MWITKHLTDTTHLCILLRKGEKMKKEFIEQVRTIESDCVKVGRLNHEVWFEPTQEELKDISIGDKFKVTIEKV